MSEETGVSGTAGRRKEMGVEQAVKEEGEEQAGRERNRQEEKGTGGDMTEAEKATETEKAYMHWLYKAAGAGSRGLLKKLERVWTAQEIYRMAREGVLADKLDARQRKQAERIQAAADGCDVAGEYEKLRARGICFVTAQEDAYPQRLKVVHDAPYALYYAGRLPDAGQKSIALIGTRNCSEYGKGI